MINTYQTSLAPPPVPPRHNRSHPVLIPTPLPSQSNSKPLLRFLVGVVVLHLVLTVGGFIYLYQTGKMGHFPSEAKALQLLSEKQETAYKPLARMVVVQQKDPKDSKPGYLQWDINHSLLRNINYYKQSWLTIPESGDYYVYFSVTFSKGHPNIPLTSQVKLRKNQTGEEKVVMQAYCDLDSNSKTSRLCTATRGDIMRLEKGNQLGVWVQDLSLVNYEDGATTFGMHKL